MKPFLTALCLGLLVIPVGAAEPIASGKQLLIKVQVKSGDPNGSVEAGTLKILSAPQLVTTENRQAQLSVGGLVPLVDKPTSDDDYGPIGLRVDIRPGKVEDGQVRLHFKLENAHEVVVSGQPTKTIESRSLQTVLIAKLGEKFKLGGLSHNGEPQWIEVTVEECKLD
ncbi:MAG: hypothetical protein JNM18_04200 [Planctomycetaceae bacterium]|nr:hypothetical protein [Planctomycetaceae bacterium]